MINNSKNRFVVRLNLETHHLLPQSGYIYKKIQKQITSSECKFWLDFFSLRRISYNGSGTPKIIASVIRLVIVPILLKLL
jgi:hypothetical protein